MNHEWQEFEKLKNKVDQHEKTISQLIEIIAATNRQLHELINQNKPSSTKIPQIYHSPEK